MVNHGAVKKLQPNVCPKCETFALSSSTFLEQRSSGNLRQDPFFHSYNIFAELLIGVIVELASFIMLKIDAGH